MLKNEIYSILLNHKDHKINQVFADENKVIFDVIVMDNEKKYYMFKWQVEKYINEEEDNTKEIKLAFFISNIIFSKSSLIEWKFK